jgi:LytS/YehU family sensor histidine kinase
MRYGTEVDLMITVEEADLKIAPLLLIIIVENVFQHGDLKNVNRPLIKILVSKGELVLETKNFIRSDHRPGNGVGLFNVRKRLEYQYKYRFEFDYITDRQIFKLKLQIKLR